MLVFLLLSFLQKNYHTFYRYSATLTQLKHKIKLQKHQIQTFSQINWKELIVSEESTPRKLLRGLCIGLSLVKCHIGGALSRWVNSTVPLSANPAIRTETEHPKFKFTEEGLYCSSKGHKADSCYTLYSPRWRQVRRVCRLGKSYWVERNTCCQKNVRGAPPCGRTIVWGKGDLEKRADSRGLGMEMKAWGGGGVGSRSGRKSVRGGHVGAPPSWKLRPQLVSGAQGRLRITAQSSIVILPLEL